MTGCIGILNVGAGDTKLVFDPSKPDDTVKAKKIVTDMLRRGFALLIQVGEDDKGPTYRRAHDFDESTGEYIIVGTGDEVIDISASGVEIRKETPENDEEQGSAPAKRGYRKATSSTKKLRVPATKAKGVAVARTAGG